MTYIYQIREEFRAINNWEYPLGVLSTSQRLISVHLVPSATIYPQKWGKIQLCIALRDEIIAKLQIGGQQCDLFEPVEFTELVLDKVFYPGVLKISKTSQGSQGISLPESIVQVEMWQ